MDAAPFDRKAVRAHRARAADGFAAHDFLVRRAAAAMAERLGELERPFPTVLDLGCHTGELAEALAGTAGVTTVVHADCAAAMTRKARARAVPDVARTFAVADEELLPFGAGVFDAVISALSLHWVNDLPGTLVQARAALRPGGLFLATLFGGETLRELRAAFLAAEAERGGAHPRVSPFADVRDAGDLLARAGFTRPVSDVDTLTVTYAHPLDLMAELRGMGEANAMRGRRRAFTARAVLLGAAAAYARDCADSGGRVPATFQVVTLTAWAPA